MLILHQYNLSPYNEKIQRMLNHKGVPFEAKTWRVSERGKILKISPTGKLPALEHDGRVIVDSTDIAYYLEATFPEKPLVPADAKLRGMMHALEDWADESLYFYEMTLRFTTPGNRERNVPRLIANEGSFLRWLMPKVLPRLLRRITHAQGVGRKSTQQLLVDTRRHIEAVSNMLGQDHWLLHNRLTLADLAVYGMFQCFRDADLSMDILREYPEVIAWMERVEEQTGTPAN